jgi:hypothetical protein
MQLARYSRRTTIKKDFSNWAFVIVPFETSLNAFVKDLEQSHLECLRKDLELEQYWTVVMVTRYGWHSHKILDTVGIDKTCIISL